VKLIEAKLIAPLFPSPLRKQYDALKAQNNGLMRKLLTGRVRVSLSNGDD
jgi:hypothetical protein